MVIVHTLRDRLHTQTVSHYLKKRHSEIRDIFSIYKKDQAPILFYLAAKRWVFCDDDYFDLSRDLWKYRSGNCWPNILNNWFFGMKLFIYGSSFKIYSVGGQAIKELKGEKIEVFENIGLYIRGFDLLDQKNSFPPNIQKTIYDFDQADLVLTEHSMVLMGKSKNWGGEKRMPILSRL